MSLTHVATVSDNEVVYRRPAPRPIARRRG